MAIQVVILIQNGIILTMEKGKLATLDTRKIMDTVKNNLLSKLDASVK